MQNVRAAECDRARGDRHDRVQPGVAKSTRCISQTAANPMAIPTPAPIAVSVTIEAARSSTV